MKHLNISNLVEIITAMIKGTNIKRLNNLEMMRKAEMSLRVEAHFLELLLDLITQIIKKGI